MPKTTNHDPDLDELPGFAQAPIPDGDPLEDEQLLEPESLQASPAPSTTSTSPSPPPSVPASSPTPSPSTTGSTEPDQELAEGIEFLAGGLFELFGQTMNRMARVRRRGQHTQRWLVTDEEAEAFAAPAARIAERRLPEELKSGDAKDVIVMSSVALEYGVRNMADLESLQPPAPAPQPTPRLHEDGPPPPAPAPQPEAAVMPAQAQPSAAAEAAPLVPPSI